ncbi:hypothetical protein ACQ4PT_037423 [Festuca glaucescens]
MAGSPPLSASATGPPLTRRQGRPTAEAASTSRPTGELQPTVETANREVRAMNQKATTAWLVKFQEATYDLDDAVDDLQDHMKQERKPSPEGARKSLPDGFVIRQHVVTQMWIVEGFINEESNCSPQDVTDRYYRELVLTNLLEPEIGSLDMKRCTVHDCVRSILQSLTKHRWFGKNTRTSTIEEAGNLISFRTVICKNPLADRGLDKMITGRKYLRVLDLTGTGIRHIPVSIALLLHLRLLNLSLTQITELPESIESLINLQFLVLRNCNGLHSLPEGISKLHRLQCLDLEGTAPQLILPNLVDLKQLTTLRGFVVNHKIITEKDVSGWPLEDLKHLNSLRSLQIVKIDRVLQSSRAQEAALEMKPHLTQLHLCGSTSDMHLHVPAAEAVRLHDVLKNLRPPGCLESLKIVSYYG